MKRDNQRSKLNFSRVSIADAIHQRGKHARTVADILSDLEKIDEYSAIRIDLTQVGQKKTHLRAALHRAAKKKKMGLVTTSDETHLYVFRASSKSK